MDAILTIGRFLYDAAHLTAALLEVFLIGPTLAVGSLGLWTWGVSALWLALFLLDWLGRVNLHGSFGKLAAGLLLPAVMGSGAMLFHRERYGGPFPPEAYLCFFLLLLLPESVLLRGT